MDRILLIAAAVICLSPAALPAQRADVSRWERQARNVTITRDDWGHAHIKGRTDADAVFGMLYAQAEDDFNRVEDNYITALGWSARERGASAIFADLRMQLYFTNDSLKTIYRTSPPWLKQLMNAFADGLNFYLYKHPEVHPRVIARFEPWMALAFSDGSIGPDIERVDTAGLRGFYDLPEGATSPAPSQDEEREPTGSNGFAIAPSLTANHRAMLLINPHTSFFFRSELQVTSDQGLNAYGAVTWGQFFIYQGFNARTGWMHTSSGVDNIDEFLETVSRNGDRWTYRVGSEERPLTTTTVRITYKTPAGMAERIFTVYHTEHGPIVRRSGNRWTSMAMMQNPREAIIESFTRTKARNYAEFLRTVGMRTNSSNNTLYADADGNIAYFHATYDPRRDTSLDYTRPVDGANPNAGWRGLLALAEIPIVRNPASGWLYNSNDAPWSAAGANTLRKDAFPPYVESGGTTARGRHAVRVLEHARDMTLDSLLAAAFDSYLPWFERTLPPLFRAFDSLPDGDLKQKLAEPVAVLRGWDLRWSSSSVPTAVAVYWGENVSRAARLAMRTRRGDPEEFVASRATGSDLLQALARAVDTLANDFGTWRTPWGDINRYQRLNDSIVGTFSDAGPSIPVPFTSSTWGSLASFGARRYPGTKKMYGTSGNSFVAVVEFGRDSVRARAVTAGGESGNPMSPHFNDQAERYASGNLREVYFYPSQLRNHTEREYHPGN